MEEHMNTQDQPKAIAIVDQFELFLITGPFLFGGILGILRYKKDSPRFLSGFQNLLTFGLFLFLVFIVFLVQKVTLFPVEILYQIQATLSLLYIAGNLTIATLALLKKKSAVAPLVQSLLDKVFRFIAQSSNNLH